jgi:Methyltransferase small domain
MRYIEGLEGTSGDLVAKLVGAYEAELHPVLDRWIPAGYPYVIDVGCAEGYYAVGFAHAMPETTVHAHDIDERARSLCRALAERNAVADRVRVGGECAPAKLAAFPPVGVALLADCEGYERVLLDPVAAPRLERWPILVELHEFLDPGITTTIQARFASTHSVEVIDERPRDAAAIPELEFMTERERAVVLSENRPAKMRWAALWPRGA